MDTCSECKIRANWNCTICNTLLCSTHKRTHNNDEQEHSFLKHKLKLPEDFKQKVLDSMSAKIYMIDQFSNQLTSISNIIVEQLSILSKAIASQLEDQRNRYLKILRLLETEIVEDQLLIIEKEVAAVLVYENSREANRWYEQEILKEGASASNRREEYLQFGYDLIQEVLNITQICLEENNIYARETGTIKGSDFLCMDTTDKIEEYNFIYHGEIENGLRHGRGNCNYSNGNVYNGEYQNGKREGTGVYQWSDGDAYNGEWKAGKIEGRGLYKWGQGQFKSDEYNGEWKAGMFEGRGIYKHASGDVYDGEWKDDKTEGRGIYKHVLGDAYDGEWKAGKKEGMGLIKWSDGDLYYGHLKAGNREGRGIYKYTSGEAYYGEFKAGKVEGRGVFRFVNGGIYYGDWKDDLKEGRGAFKSASGHAYDGVWKAGKRCREVDKFTFSEAGNEEGKTQKRKCL